MTKIGEAKKQDRSAIEKILKTGSAQDIYDIRESISAKELSDAMSRLNYEQQMHTKYGVTDKK
jgi:AAA+ superfamily predicted ATPase